MIVGSHPSKNTFGLLATVAALPLAAGCSMRSQVADAVHDSWHVLKEYEQDGYSYFIVQEGPRYRKIAQLPSGPVYTLYEVDTVTRHCKWSDTLIDCASLRADPDMGGFITWLGPTAVVPLAPPPKPATTTPPAPTAAPAPTAPPTPAAPPASGTSTPTPYDPPAAPSPQGVTPWD